MENLAGTTKREGMHRDTLFTAALILVRLIVLVLFLAEIRRGNFGGPDVVRFHALALHGGSPWRDYPVEYAPLELLLLRGLFGVGILGAATRLALLTFAADLATWAAVRTGWGRRAALLYLTVGLPVVILELQRIDLVTVAVAMWAFVLVRRSRPVAGGTTLAVAVLLKFWPLIVLPGIWIRGRVRSVGAFAGTAAIGMTAWIVWGGFGALSQVVSFRAATGWEAGSTVGSLVWVFGGEAVREEAGAARVGVAPGWAKVLLGIVLLSILVCVWRRAIKRGEEGAGAPALTAVAALLLLSPLFSTQYVLWLLPWAGIAALDDEHPVVPLVTTFLICATTAVVATYLYGGSADTVVKAASLIRVTLLAVLVGRGLVAGLHMAPDKPARSAAG
ncbi:MAG: glycosyltransferase family 87 protein [Actinomycetota bacterium]